MPQSKLALVEALVTERAARILAEEVRPTARSHTVTQSLPQRAALPWVDEAIERSKVHKLTCTYMLMGHCHPVKPF